MSMLGRGKEYLVKAATIILLCNALVFVMQSFDWSFVPIAEGMEKSSILGSVSQPIALLLVPIVGVAAWQMAAATVTGFIAKENVVGTLAVCYGISNLIDTEELSMAQGAGTEVAAVFGITRVAALAFLVLNLFSPPCFAAIGAMNAEIDDKKWFWGGIGLQIGVGYTLGFLVYQLGTLITEGKLGAGFFGGLCVVVLFCFVLAVLCIRGQKKINSKAKGVKV
jgi:ferrous iron transport protein B